jgi:hypothetical protein
MGCISGGGGNSCGSGGSMKQQYHFITMATIKTIKEY